MRVYLEQFVFRGRKYDLEIDYEHLGSKKGTRCVVEQGWLGSQEITPQLKQRMEQEAFADLVAACKAEIAAFPDDYPLSN